LFFLILPNKEVS